MVYEVQRRYDMTLRLQEQERQSIHDIRNLQVETNQGNQVPLSAIAAINYETGPAQISREQIQRRIVVGVNTGERDVASLIEAIRQKLDQELSTDTLKAYYEANQSRFRLSAPVLKIRYLAVPPSAPDQSKLTDWFQSDKNYHLDSLYRYARQHAQHFSLGNDQWQYYPEVRERFKLPAQAEPFLTNNQTHQTSLGDTANLHMGIKTYKLKNTTAPFPLKEQQVREALLNQRKKALFNEMEEEAIQEGLQQDKVQRYD
jgi:hypothetical protein